MLLLPAAAALLLLSAATPSLAAEAVDRSYVGSAACAACHADAAEAWRGSHHALAWTEATPENVLADFDGTTFSHDGMTARFRRDADGAYRVEVAEKDGATTDHRIHSVAGVSPLQQYLIETQPGRLQSFDVVWDVEQGRWYHLYPDQDLPPSNGLHWTGPYKTWNARCAECHATGYLKAYDVRTRRYASSQVEIGVGCEACHGPGDRHVAWAEDAPESPPPKHGFDVDMSDRDEALNQCATCHSRREAHLDGNPPPGTPFADAYTLALLRPGLYHADGQILEEVYVYGSFLQSKMHAAGVGCGDCHDPHTGERLADGNAVCTQCHNPEGREDYPTLTPALYDDPSHHHHPQGSDAAQCKSCHMVERVYMGIDWRADHAFHVPRPDLAALTGAPDACTNCHMDQTPAWAAASVREWNPDARRGPTFGVTLAQARANAPMAAEDLAVLALDPEAAGIVRATALWFLEQAGSPEIAARMAPLLRDPDAVVRAAAVGVQRTAPPQDRTVRILPVLSDPTRTVRMAAARSLLDAPIARLPNAMAADLRSAMGEWQASLATRLDFPETHLQIAGISMTQRNWTAASAAFREVVELDPQRREAWTMLLRIASATQGAAAVRSVLEDALQALPHDPELRALELRIDAP